MTDGRAAINELLATLGPHLLVAGLGVLLVASGVWQLSRGLRGLGDPNPRNVIVLPGRRTREGKVVVIRTVGAVVTFLGFVFLAQAVVRAILDLTA